MFGHRLCIFVVALILFGASVPSRAQTSLASLRGRVIDQSGAVLPGASVTVRQTDTDTTRTGLTNGVGQFYLPSLPAGTYEMTVEMQGFTTSKRTLILHVGEQANAELTLFVAGTSEKVEVTGQSAVVETQSAVGGGVNTQEIDNLPTLERNFADIAMITPGVTSSGQSSEGFSAGGQHQYQNQVIVDGATNVQQFYGTVGEFVPPDWIQEFQVYTNGFSTDYGQATGGLVNVVTRSGGNVLSARIRVLPKFKARQSSLRRPLHQRPAHVPRLGPVIPQLPRGRLRDGSNCEGQAVFLWGS